MTGLKYSALTVRSFLNKINNSVYLNATGERYRLIALISAVGNVVEALLRRYLKAIVIARAFALEVSIKTRTS
jgi:hypothetical protein